MKKLLILTALSFIGAATPAFANTSHDGTKGWVDHFFKEADTDGNGTISKDEFMAYSEKKFDKMDTDQNGELTKAEVVAFKKKEMQKHRHHAAMHSRQDNGNAPVNNEAANDDMDRTDTSADAKTNSRSGSDNGK